MRAKHTRPRKDRSRRDRRRAQRPSWVPRFRRLNRALATSARMIEATRAAVRQVAERAVRSPVRATRELHRLSARLIAASVRLERAVRGLHETSDAVLLDPRRAREVPRLLAHATERWLRTAMALEEVSSELFALQESLLDDLESGRLAPETETPRRRIRIVRRPSFVRAFLRCRRSCAHDRIASLPARRRRTACRATTDAPRRICRGRAPPLLANCLL